MKSKYSKWFSCWLCVVAAILIGSASTGLVSAETDKQVTKAITDIDYAAKPATPLSDRETQAAISSAKSLSKAFRHAASCVLPAVVAIENRPKVKQVGSSPKRAPDGGMSGGNNPFKGSPFEELFRNSPGQRQHNPAPQPQRRGVGSGVIIDSSGLVLTNNHVVAGGGTIVVRLHDGREFEADKVWTDPKTDIAVVQIPNAENLVAAQLGNSNDSFVGDWVLALGQPFGLESTVTAGIISAKGRGIGLSASENHIQTDAAINPGNSGGPMVNLDGEVIGINTAISSRGGGNDGVGFAVPINLASWVADQLVENGSVQRAFLGVGIQPITQKLANQFNVQPRQGLLITQVYSDSPAAKAGFRIGDVLIEFAGAKVSAPNEFQTIVERAEIGQRYEIIVVRDGKQKKLIFAPQSQPESFGQLASTNSQTKQSPPSSSRKIGLTVGELDSELAEKLGVDSTGGIVISAVSSPSPAEQAGLQVGMIIVEANRQKVESVDQFESIVDDIDLDDGLLLLVKSQRGSRYVVVQG